MSTLNVLFDQHTVRERIQELGREITNTYGQRALTVVVVLKGAIFFAADLLRSLPNPVDIQFVELLSRPTERQNNEVRIHYWSHNFDVKGKEVLVIEDILDTGITLDFLVRRLEQLGAGNIRVCCLLEKPSRRRVNIQADFVGFVIEDVFVVGLGLHDDNRFRNLPYIAQIVDERS